MNVGFARLWIELTVTETGPVLAPAGTTATICVSIQLVIEEATVPLKLQVLAALRCAEVRSRHSDGSTDIAKHRIKPRDKRSRPDSH